MQKQEIQCLVNLELENLICLGNVFCVRYINILAAL